MMNSCHNMKQDNYIDPDANLGKQVQIGPGAIIYENVTIGDDCFIGPHVILGEPTKAYYTDPDEYQRPPTVIGTGSIIRAHTCIYAGVRIGENFQSGSFVTIRENTVIEAECRVGSYNDIQGECTIGKGCAFHSSVHIAQYSTIGNYVWIFPYTLILNAPVAPIPHGMQLEGATIGDYSVLLAKSLLMAGVTLGKHVVVAANSKVTRDVPDWIMVHGDPAKEIGDSRKFIFRHKGKLYRPYPWMLHRKDGYPWEHEIPSEWELGRGR